MNTSANKKTSEEWYDEFDDIEIMDPDGWDRSNFGYSWFEEEITKKEFMNRVMRSTCKNISKSILNRT